MATLGRTQMGNHTQGMRVDGMDTQFSSAGLPASFGNYRPPQNFDDDIDSMPPPTFADAKGMNSFRSKAAEMPQPPLTGAPGKAKEMKEGLFQASSVPASLTQQGRPKDFLQQALLDSQGGTDQVVTFSTPVVRERATGVTGDQVPMPQTKVDLKADADTGVYDGELIAGEIREGRGVCRYKSGNVYEGEWKQNKRDGHGNMHYVSGAEYDGSWVENERSGHGIMKYRDSSSYEGQWLRDLKHGYGCYTFASGAIYTGQWFEGKMHGQGTYTFADGQQFTGEFDRNLKAGFGTHTYTNRDTWDGVWVSDEPHGTGMYIFSDTGQKIETHFVGAGEPRPTPGKLYQGHRVLRKEDKLKIVQDGEDSAMAARKSQDEAARVSAEARKLTNKILEDTATLLGLVEEED